MRERGFIVWLVLLALLLVVLNLPESLSRNAKSALREALAPLQGAASGVSRRVKEGVESVRGFGDLVSENQTMSAELVRLRNDVRRLETLEKVNIELRRQLRFSETTPRDLISCEVIARDISGWWQTVRLGKGRADGLERNMAVVTAEGLVGRTVAVSPRTADVLLLSDPGCRVSAQIARTGVFGILSGQGTSWRGQVSCLMDLINKNTPVRPGDEVTTSGLGGVFPKGLLVGYVERVEMDQSDLYQRAHIIPKADLGDLDYVFAVAQRSDPIVEMLRTRGLSGEGGP